MTDILKIIKKKTKGMDPATRFIWVEKNIFNPLRRESIRYVNGEPIPVSEEPETVAEAILNAN